MEVFVQLRIASGLELPITSADQEVAYCVKCDVEDSQQTFSTNAISFQGHATWDQDFYYDGVENDFGRLTGCLQFQIYEQTAKCSTLIGLTTLDFRHYSTEELEMVELPVVYPPKLAAQLAKQRRSSRLVVSVVGRMAAFSTLCQQLEGMVGVVACAETSELYVPIASTPLYAGIAYTSTGVNFMLCSKRRPAEVQLDFGHDEAAKELVVHRRRHAKPRRVATGVRFYEELILEGLPLSADLDRVWLLSQPCEPVATYSLCSILEAAQWAGLGAGFEDLAGRMAGSVAHVNMATKELLLWVQEEDRNNDDDDNDGGVNGVAEGCLLALDFAGCSSSSSASASASGRSSPVVVPGGKAPALLQPPTIKAYQAKSSQLHWDFFVPQMSTTSTTSTVHTKRSKKLELGKQEHIRICREVVLDCGQYGSPISLANSRTGSCGNIVGLDKSASSASNLRASWSAKGQGVSIGMTDSFIASSTSGSRTGCAAVVYGSLWSSPELAGAQLVGYELDPSGVLAWPLGQTLMGITAVEEQPSKSRAAKSGRSKGSKGSTASKDSKRGSETGGQDSGKGGSWSRKYAVDDEVARMGFWRKLYSWLTCTSSL